MHWIDWCVLCGSMLFIVAYGIWKTRNTQSMESFFLGGRELKWYTIGLSIMATQASGITFLSTPGQAYTGGLGFIQFYFGLPIAMVLLSVYVLPKFYGLRVYTAYEFLEQRFDIKVRQYTALLFLFQRGMAAGLTIYAPSIILCSLLGWDLNTTCLLMGGVVIIYTVLGGSKAVSVTQQQQMIIIFVGLLVAFVVAILKLPEGVRFGEALTVAGEMSKMKAVDFQFDPASRYNFWSGIIGGTFLSLSYFGTDQSQVQRYLSGKSLRESRLGLLFNGILKVPMQLLVLMVGIMVFVFYQFQPVPVHFNSTNTDNLAKNATYGPTYKSLSAEYDLVHEQKSQALREILALRNNQSDAPALMQARVRAYALVAQEDTLRKKVEQIITQANPKAVTNDRDYIFLRFVTDNLPIGIIGLLLAAIFAASMSSTSSELNALATTTIIDFYRRSWVKNQTDTHYYRVGQIFTLLWGAVILVWAISASLFDNLIQAVNLIGSVFYGTILGIFLCAFFIKYLKARSVFIGGLVGQLIILYLNFYSDVAFLWFNLLGAALVIGIALLVEAIIPQSDTKSAEIIDN